MDDSLSFVTCDEKCIISVDELPGGMVANALLR